MSHLVRWPTPPRPEPAVVQQPRIYLPKVAAAPGGDNVPRGGAVVSGRGPVVTVALSAGGALAGGRTPTPFTTSTRGGVLASGPNVVARVPLTRGPVLTQFSEQVVFLNGMVKDYDPPDGINNVEEIRFNPISQDWQANTTFACPQGFGPANTFPQHAVALGIPADSGIIWKRDRNLWVSGTSDYVRYDKTTDTVDGLDYVAVTTITLTTTRPGLSSQWTRIINQGFMPRAIDAGFYGSVRVTGDATRWFSCEERKHGTSGSVEPSGTFPQLDGTVYWEKVPNFKGAWVAATGYTVGDYILEDGSFWRCQQTGTSGGSEPSWSGTGYGSSLDDPAGGDDVIWQRRYVHAGAWAGTTNYGFRVVQGAAVQQGGNDVRKQAVTYSGDSTAFLLVAGVKPSNAQTGSTEPAWTAASGLSFWEDGEIIWRFGSFDASGLQNERLVITGLAAASNGKQVTIRNVATGGSLRDVVLADQVTLSRSGVNTLDGSDQESTKPFDFGGAGNNIRLGEGQMVKVEYSTSTGLWTAVAGADDRAPTAGTPVPRGGVIASGRNLTASTAVGRGQVIVSGRAPTVPESNTPIPGGLLASGRAPTPTVPGTRGGVVATGRALTALTSVTRGGVIVTGRAPQTRTVSTRGGSVVTGRTATVRVPIQRGVVIASGRAPGEPAGGEGDTLRTRMTTKLGA